MKTLLLFATLALSINVFGQSKKDQIITLNNSIDSLNAVLVTTRDNSTKDIESRDATINELNSEITQLKSDVSSLESSWAKLTKDNEKLNAQTNGSWVELNLNGVGSFRYPASNLEIQNIDLKTINDAIRASYSIEVPPSKLTLQQTGLNSAENYKYARVIVEKYSGSPDDYLNKSTKLSSLSDNKKKEIIGIYESSVVDGYKAMSVEIVKWYPVELEEINNQFAIHLHWEHKSTIRKGNVDTHLYCFPDNNKETDITLSCRQVNVEEWKKIYLKIANSFLLN
tara:strand:+ start:1117 stop:1965 length:849 start_codon:yes stop_codon:yes gene_type:complete